MEHANSVVCICESREVADRAVESLASAGVDLEALSIATRDTSPVRQEIDAYQPGDQTFSIPNLGFLLVHGPLACWIVDAFDNEASAGGVSIVGDGLATLGIPRQSILEYEAALKSDKYLLVMHGSPENVATAAKVIGGTSHCSHTVHGEKVFDTVHSATPPEVQAYTYQA